MFVVVTATAASEQVEVHRLEVRVVRRGAECEVYRSVVDLAVMRPKWLS